ncbi:MAG: sigma-70 family RNA polymerase sigma factor [Planctomycetes bacterium]|nr:sigma-70 family RNA polymerase sigma factor [Planctomycetota bacterium]
MAEALRSLIEAARAGDRSALNRLAGCVDTFVRIFHGSLSRKVRSSYGSTMDFVLEGLAEALSRLGGFEYRSDEQFYAWAARFIRNRILETGRRAGRKKRGAEVLPLDGEADRAEAPGPTPSEAASTGELREVVAEALLELQVRHPTEMAVVLAKVFEDRSWPEVSDSLGLSSEKRARNLFVKGLDLLRPLVEKRLGGRSFEDLLGP